MLVRVLLSDGSGLTARQCATLLSDAGHTVGALSPIPWCLCRFTNRVRRVHPVPAFGLDPYAWLDRALEVYQREAYDVLLPTHEQVAVLAACAETLQDKGVSTAIPAFEAFARVMDKASAFQTLQESGVPQPRSRLVGSAAELQRWQEFPVFLKLPIGTAASGVRRIDDAAELAALPPPWLDAADAGRLLAQAPVDGPLAMVQAILDRGELVAFHAARRVRLGARHGASHKESLRLPDVRAHLATLGRALSWHGALSADVMLGLDGPMVVDVNPRLVEPFNARASGVDLVGPLLDLARGRGPVAAQPDGRSGVRTHQLALAILGAGERGTRRAVASELAAAAGHRGAYRDSAEELAPGLRRDPRGIGLLLATATATLVRPAAWRWFAGGSVDAYALGADGWNRILARRATPDDTAG